MNIDALDLAVRQPHIQIVLPIGVVIILVQNLDSCLVLLRVRRPIFGPVKSHWWLSQHCNNFFTCHARLNRQQILVGQRPLALPCDARA